MDFIDFTHYSFLVQNEGLESVLHSVEVRIERFEALEAKARKEGYVPDSMHSVVVRNKALWDSLVEEFG